MIEPPVQPFEDPALKSALRRTLGQESAPAELRARIASMARQGSADAGTSPAVKEHKPIRMFRQSPLYKFALAAVLLICFGVSFVIIRQINRPPDYTAYDFPKQLYNDMTVTHNARLASSAGDSVTNLASANALAKQVNRPVFAADLTKDGWTFQGGGVRNVGSHPAAQLFFTKGKAAISIFSLPAAAVPKAPDGAHYDITWKGAGIAGFTHKGGLYCIVGSSEDGSLNVDEVKRLLQEHESEISKT